MSKLNEHLRHTDYESIANIIAGCIRTSEIYTDYAIKLFEPEHFESAYGMLTEADERIAQYIDDIGLEANKHSALLTGLSFRIDRARQKVEVLEVKLREQLQYEAGEAVHCEKAQEVQINV